MIKLETLFNKTKNAKNLLPLIIISIALLIRLMGLEYNSLWLDEAWTFIGLSEKKHHFLEISAIYNYIINFLSEFFNLYSEFNLRFMSAISGVLSALVVFKITRSFTNELYAFIAGIAVSISPLLIVYAQDYSVYIFLSCIMTLLFYAYIKWTANFSYKYAITFGVLCLVAINTRPQALFLVFPLIGFSIFAFNNANKQKKIKSIILVSSIASISLLSVFHAVLFTNMMANQYSHTIDINLIIRVYHLLMTALFNLPNKVTVYSPVTNSSFYFTYAEYFRCFFVILFLVISAFYIMKKEKHMIALGVGIVVFTLLTSISIIKSNQLFERYLLIIQPLIIIYLFVFLCQIGKTNKYINSLGLMFLIGLLVFWLHLSYLTVNKVAWKPPYRDAFAKIEMSILNNKSSYCIVPYYYEWPIARYYLNNNSKIKLLDKTFDFYNNIQQALLHSTTDYKELVSKQIQMLNAKKAKQIFIFTRRGKNLLPFIKEEFGSLYKRNIIYETAYISVHEFLLKEEIDDVASQYLH